jgi:hypothetical protein
LLSGGHRSRWQGLRSWWKWASDGIFEKDVGFSPRLYHYLAYYSILYRPETKRDHYHNCYRAILSLAPGFRKRILDFEGQPAELDALVTQVLVVFVGSACRWYSSHSRWPTRQTKLLAMIAIGSKSTGPIWFYWTLRRTSTTLPSLLPSNHTRDSITSVQPGCYALKANTKHSWQILQRNYLLAIMFCTQILCRVQTKLITGAINVTADEWPHFLYDNDEYDSEEVDKGLLCGYLLLRVSVIVITELFTHIFLDMASHICFAIRSCKPPDRTH